MAIGSSTKAWPRTVRRAVASGWAAVVVKPNFAWPALTSRFTAASRLAFFTPSMSRKGYQSIWKDLASKGCSQE